MNNESYELSELAYLKIENYLYSAVALLLALVVICLMGQYYNISILFKVDACLIGFTILMSLYIKSITKQILPADLINEVINNTQGDLKLRNTVNLILGKEGNLTRKNLLQIAHSIYKFERDERNDKHDRTIASQSSEQLAKVLMRF